MSGNRTRVVIFISGSGSNMVRLVESTREDDFPAEVVGVISDKAQAGGIAKAEALGIPAVVIARGDYASKAEHEAAILMQLAEFKPHVICLAGFMRLLSADFIARWQGKIINIHPSLLPLFPGLHTHQRAIDAGVKIAGCTVHHVTEGMDEGAIIAQAAVPVLAGDTADTLAQRVLAVEHQIYPAVLRMIASGETTRALDENFSLISFG
jgi:phosphoribosylglycinamide formyltransferase 1